MLANVCKKSFTASVHYINFYTGGDILWSVDGLNIYCLNGSRVFVLNIISGQVSEIYGISCSKNIKSEDKNIDDAIYCFALSELYLVTAHRSGLLRLWELASNKLLKLWKSQHKGPIVKMAFSPCGNIVCTSGGDCVLKLWDFTKSHCLCILRDFSGPSVLLKFHPNFLKQEIYAVGADNFIYCWDYAKKKLIRKLRGHLSQVTGLIFPDSNNQLVTISRDKVLIHWQLESDDAKQLKVLPLYAELVGAYYIRNGQKVLVACLNGKLQLIDLKTSKILGLMDGSDFEVTSLLYSGKQNQIALVTTEQNILIYSINEETNVVTCVKQLIGYNDQIMDMCCLGANDRYLVVATNSKDLKLYDTENNMNCRLIMGHKDIIMSLSAVEDLLLSAGKDRSIILWQLEPNVLGLKYLMQQIDCHTSTIGCISFMQNSSVGFASVCQDGCMKVWQVLNDKLKNYSFGIRYAALAHDKEINCVAFAPNNKIIATSAQDKTAKLWHCDKNTALGVLRGHTRGVGCVRFSPVDQILLTSSSDCSLRIWSVANYSCLKRLELENAVLRVEFIDNGKYIVSAGTDGLLKLWNIKTNTCVQTIDEHSDRVWTIAVPSHSNKYFFSGGADSKLIRYVDITQTAHNEALEKRQETLDQEQTLQSLLHQRQHFRKAFVLALTLGKPKASYGVISHYVRERDNVTIADIIETIDVDLQVTLLEHVKAWCTNSRHTQVSNLILQHLIDKVLVNHKMERLFNYSNVVEALTPYMHRHFKRITEMNKELAYLEFILNCMKSS